MFLNCLYFLRILYIQFVLDVMPVDKSVELVYNFMNTLIIYRNLLSNYEGLLMHFSRYRGTPFVEDSL